jgi:hypothetical protein
MTNTREKYFYSGNFPEQFERAMHGYAPWRAAYNREYKQIPPTGRQKWKLKSLGVTKMPASKGEASSLIDRLLKGAER